MQRTVLSLGFLLLASQAFAACQVPDTIEGREFVNAVDSNYSKQNPNAGTIMKMHFGKETYESDILTKGFKVQGKYRYKKLSKTIGEIQATELYDGQTTVYSISLACLTDYTGTGVFTQLKGAIKPDQRQNTLRYTMVRDSPNKGENKVGKPDKAGKPS